MTYFKVPTVHKIEHTVEDKIKQAIISQNGYVIKNQASATTGRGKPDLSACIDGKYYGIEVKREGKDVETTKEQVSNLQKIAYAGGLAFWSKTTDVVDSTILEMDYNVTSVGLKGKPNKDLKTIKTWLRKPNVQAIRYAYYPANASYTDVIEIYTKRKI